MFKPFFHLYIPALVNVSQQRYWWETVMSALLNGHHRTLKPLLLFTQIRMKMVHKMP
jgi:hypothetical protein